MKNHFAVTVSDAYGSRHYTVKKTVKRTFALTLTLVVSVTSGSISYNVLQHRHADALGERNAWLEQRNSSIGEKLAFHTVQAREIRGELDEIERLTQLGNGGNHAALVQRLRSIGQFYAEYSDIGARLTQIENMISDLEVSPGTHPASADEGFTLATRIDRATLSVQQETIMHNSIPSGYPSKTRRITSKYGDRIHPVTKKKSFHKGVDLRAKGKQDVYVTADGIVRTADYTKLSGNRVIVQHNYGFQSHYAHLHKSTVKEGEVVYKGDVVGISGNSGLSAAPHLHYEIRYLGEPINPVAFLNWEFGSHKIFTQVKSVKWPSLINLISKQITQPTLQLSLQAPTSPARSK